MMAAFDCLNVNIKVNVSDETVANCLKVLEIWLNDNPWYTIIGNRGDDGKITLERKRLDDPSTGG